MSLSRAGDSSVKLRIPAIPHTTLQMRPNACGPRQSFDPLASRRTASYCPPPVGAKTILLLNLSETSRDPRVRRVGETLAQQGHRVVAINPAFEVQTPSEQHGPIEIRRFPVPQAYGHREMAQLEAHAPEAARIVRGASPEVMDRQLRRPYYLHRRWHGRGSRLIDRIEHRIGIESARIRRAYDLLGPAPEDNEIPRIRSIMVINLELARLAATYRPDVVHANDLDTLLAGLILKLQFGIPLVYDAHEIYPEQFPENERSPTWHSFYTALEQALILRTDARMTVCDSLGDYFQRRYASAPFVTVRNTPSIRFLVPEDVLLRRNQPVRLLYHGALFKHRGLEQLIESARYLRSARIVLRGFGDHTTALQELATRLEVGDRVEFAPAVAVDDLVAKASESDIGLNPFPSACLNTEYALPNKVFEYMMGGLAVVSSNLIELRRLTQALDIGRLFRSLDPREMAEDLEALAAAPDQVREYRRNAHRQARETYHWEHEQQRLMALYRALLH